MRRKSGNGSAAQQVQLHEQRAHQLLNEKKPELAIKEFAAVLEAGSAKSGCAGKSRRFTLLSKELCSG